MPGFIADSVRKQPRREMIPTGRIEDKEAAHLLQQLLKAETPEQRSEALARLEDFAKRRKKQQGKARREADREESW